MEIGVMYCEKRRGKQREQSGANWYRWHAYNNTLYVGSKY